MHIHAHICKCIPCVCRPIRAIRLHARALRKARLWHPDKNRSTDAADRFRALRAAYETLSCPTRRGPSSSWAPPFSPSGVCVCIVVGVGREVGPTALAQAPCSVLLYKTM